MNKKRNLIIVIVLLLLLGTGSFVFANPSEEDISGTGNMRNGDSSQTTNDSDEDYDYNYNENNDNTNNSLNDIEGNNTDTVINSNQNNSTSITNRRYISNGAGVSVGNIGTNNSQDNHGNVDGNNSTNNNGSGEDNSNNPNDNESNNKPSVDNSYELALAAVEKARDSLKQTDVDEAQRLVDNVLDENKKNELQNILDSIQEIIDISYLVEQLANKVNNATNKNDMDDARNFRNNEKIINKVNSLSDSTRKDELVDILKKLSEVLDDTDAPVITGINNGDITNKVVSIAINDINEVSIILNGQIVSKSELENINEDGIYELKVIDKAFNETSIIFTIDMNNPIIIGIENNAYYNKEVVINSNEEVEVYLEKDGIKVDNYKIGDTIKEDGVYKVYVEDKAGNVSETITFTIDTKNPIITGIENNAYYNKEVVINSNEEVEVYLEKDGVKVDNYNVGDTLKEDGVYKVYATDKAGNVSETITFTIDTIKPTAVISYSTKALTNGVVVARLENASETIKILNNNGSNEYIFMDNGEFVFEIEDLAGNKERIIAKVTNIDKEVPVYKNLGILNLTNYGTGKDVSTAKALDEVAVFITFNEKLAVNPKVLVNGKEYISYLDNEKSTDNNFIYVAKYIVSDTDEGEIQVVVKDYADEAGNVGADLNNDNINHSTYKQVKVVLASSFEFVNGASFNTSNIVIKNPNYAYMTVYNWQTKETDRTEENTYIVSDNTMYTFTLYDKDNNILEQAKMIYDDINPKIIGLGKIGSGTSEIVSEGVYDSVNLTITDNDLHIIKRVFDDGHEEVIKEYNKYDNDKNKYDLSLKDNGTYNIVVVDRAGNESSIKFSIKEKSFFSAILSVFGL